MRPADQSQLLRLEIERSVLSISRQSPFYALLREALDFAIFSSDKEEMRGRPWPLLPLMVCECQCGVFEQALPAAAALHLLKTAAEIFDDVEDADSARSLAAGYGTAVAINAASTLIVLAEKTLTALPSRGIDDGCVIRVIDAVNSFYIAAGAGQHMDLSHPAGSLLSEEEYLEIARQKSASVIACSCQVGALLASADQSTVDKYTQFGYDLGMLSQIANDIQGITTGNDIVERKITLPAIFALTRGSIEIRKCLEDYFRLPSDSGVTSEEIARCLFESGAVYYSLVKMELYKRQALSFLSEEESRGKKVNPLRIFVE